MTREEAIQKTINLWSGMQAFLGDNPVLEERARYKAGSHARTVKNGCYLCEYAKAKNGGVWDRECKYCPVQHWPGRHGCEHVNFEKGMIDWRCSPISDILEVLEKELKLIKEEGDTCITDSSPTK